MNLDLIHIDGSSTDLGCHLDTLTLDSRCVGGHEALKLRLVLLNHRKICTETTGSQNNRSSIYGYAVAGLTGCVDTNCLIAIHEDLVSRCVEKKSDVLTIFDVLLEDRDEVSTDSDGLAVLVYRTVDTLYGSTTEGTNVVHLCADGIEPVDRICRLAAEGLYELEVVQALATDHGVKLEELYRIEVTGRVCLIICVLLLDCLCKCGDVRVICVLLLRSCELRLYTGILTELVLILPLGLRSIETTGCTYGVTADHRLGLYEHNGLTSVCCLDRCRHTCTAGTDDNDICVECVILCLRSSGDLVLEISRIEARALDRCLYSLDDGVGCIGCTGNGVYLYAVVLDHCGWKLSDGLITDTLGLLLLGNLDLVELILRHGNLYRYVTVVSLRCTGRGHSVCRNLACCLRSSSGGRCLCRSCRRLGLAGTTRCHQKAGSCCESKHQIHFFHCFFPLSVSANAST